MVGLPKILIVEDNVQLGNLYKLFFQYNGYDVELASDSPAALTKAKDHQPDIIFLDIMLPGKDGFDILQLLRNDESYGCVHKKIVMLTNLGDGAKISAEIRNNMDGYAVKSEITLNDLLKIVHSFDKQQNIGVKNV